MPKEFSFSWYEWVLRHTTVPFPILSLIIGASIYLFYLLLQHLYYGEIYLELNGFAINTLILVPFQLIGVHFLLTIWRRNIKLFKFIYSDFEGVLYNQIDGRLRRSYLYYILIIAVIAPYFLADLISPTSGDLMKQLMKQYFPAYSQDVGNYLALSLDICWLLSGILALFLLATILWIIINIPLALKDVSDNYYNLSMNESVFSMNSKLRPIRDSIMKALTYYFIDISLLAISYIDLTRYLHEVIILLLFLLIGILFFFVGFQSISKLLNGQLQIEQDKINKRSQEYLQQLTNLHPANRCKNIEEISQISTVLDILQKQREVIGEINTRVYDLRSILSFLGVLLLPIITEILKKFFLFGSTGIVNYGGMLMNSTFNKLFGI